MQKEPLIWIGVRESDIDNVDLAFAGSITIFGSGKDNNQALERTLGMRPNYNDDCPEFAQFVNDCAEVIITDTPNCRFMLYAPEDIHTFSKQVQERCCNNNGCDILAFFENKIYTKMWLRGTVSILPFIALLGAECSYPNLCRLFTGMDEFVVQADTSCGGYQTYKITEKNERDTLSQLFSHRIYTVSPYKHKSISVNIHLIIYRQDVVTFPGSVQIINSNHEILQYCGSDFIAYSLLPAHILRQLEQAAYAIGKRIQGLGYLGICGIDLLFAEETVFFMEVNPRFQASTFLLNRALTACGLPSVQLYCFDAFNNTSCTLPMPQVSCVESFYNYSYTGGRRETLEWLHSHMKSGRDAVACIDDCLDWDYPLEEHTYLFKVVFSQNIVFAHELYGVRLHENIAQAECVADGQTDKDNLIQIKIALMNSGTRISPVAEQYMHNHGGVDYLEFSALNLQLDGKIWVSVPYQVKLSESSPFCINYDSVLGLVLSCRNRCLFTVKVQTDDPISYETTSSGTPFSEISYLSPDRLRIYHRYGCYYKDMAAGCLFCDMPEQPPRFSEGEIEEVINAYANDSRINHYLIGGGSRSPTSDFSEVIRIASYIKERSDKPISLMSLPTADRTVLSNLLNAGITDVSFNIETFDRDLAKTVMPGKSGIPLDYYMESLEAATEFWGKTGNVRSIIIVGLDEADSFASGIKRLCEICVSPVLSLLRPPESGPMSHWIAPRNQEILDAYKCAEGICMQWNVMLGPKCPACENNVIKVTC